MGINFSLRMYSTLLHMTENSCQPTIYYPYWLESYHTPSPLSSVSTQSFPYLSSIYSNYNASSLTAIAQYSAWISFLLENYINQELWLCFWSSPLWLRGGAGVASTPEQPGCVLLCWWGPLHTSTSSPAHWHLCIRGAWPVCPTRAKPILLCLICGHVIR